MQSSILIAAFWMGLAGGPHCIAMCGAACAGVGTVSGLKQPVALTLFQVGRVLGYSALGALAAASMQGLGWLTTQSVALRPVWSLLHIAAMALGAWLLITARQPVWLEEGAKRVWQKVRVMGARWGAAAPLGLGAVWAFMPCGLLYSALTLAALSGRAVDGALAMAVFAAASGFSLALGPWLWMKLGGRGNGTLSMRVAGLALLAASAFALWMGLMHDQAPWCVTPPAA